VRGDGPTTIQNNTHIVGEAQHVSTLKQRYGFCNDKFGNWIFVFS